MVRQIFLPQLREGKGKNEDRELERREEKGEGEGKEKNAREMRLWRMYVKDMHVKKSLHNREGEEREGLSIPR